jgi:ApaG protein
MSSSQSDFGSEAVTRGIRVSVAPVFDAGRSDTGSESWIYLYTVTILNEGDEVVQLMDRHWVITDETGQVEEVRGPGVVGEQPVLKPGEGFEYTSACPLRTPTGTMRGSYRFTKPDGGSFSAEIAEFILSEPYTVH